jgi:hypothetical protein
MKSYQSSINGIISQHIEYDFKGTKIKVRPHNLSNHQKEILDALDIKLK